jgi:hypothetical protein
MLRFTLPGAGRQIEMKATVVRYRPDGTVGTRFAQVSASHIKILRSWIADSLQKQLALPDDKEAQRPGLSDARSVSVSPLPPVHI